MRYACNESTQKGLTLIEIMIALLIGVFLLGGVINIFINSQQTYRMQEGLSRLQENGRFAMDFITRDVRMSGYWGCLNPSAVDVDIAGTDNNGAGTVDSVDDGTDTLTLRGAFSQIPVGVCGTAVNTAAAYYTDASSTISYRINNIVLQRTDAAGVFQDLIEGVENMQILYGVDTDADFTANYYVPGTAANIPVANWPTIVSIRILLLVRSIDDNLAAQPVPYTYNGITTTAVSVPAVTDRRIRRVFTSTIVVRNRLP